MYVYTYMYMYRHYGYSAGNFFYDHAAKRLNLAS